MLNKLKELRDAREEGFTLIELLVVIVIIGILAAIALPIFLNQQKAAIAAGVKSDVRNTVTNVATALVKNPTADATTLDAITPVQTGTDVVTIAGDWTGYSVSGKNSGINGTFTFYSSDTATAVGTDTVKAGAYVASGTDF